MTDAFSVNQPEPKQRHGQLIMYQRVRLLRCTEGWKQTEGGSQSKGES